jgi:hypothetical protein
VSTQDVGIWRSQGVEVDDAKPPIPPRLGKAYASSEGRVILVGVGSAWIVEYKEYRGLAVVPNPVQAVSVGQAGR